MARRENTVPTEQFTVSTTPQVVALLEELARMGLHGKNRAEVAVRLIEDALLQLVKDEVVDRPKRNVPKRR